MSHSVKKYILVALSVVFLFNLLYFGGRYFIFGKLKSEILKEVAVLREEGYEIGFDSLQTSSLQNKISLVNLNVTFPKEGICKDTAMHITAASIAVSGIEFLPLLFQKELKIKAIILHAPHVRYSKLPASQRKKSAQKKAIKSIQITSLILASATIDLADSSSCMVDKKIKFDLDIDEITVMDPSGNSQRVAFEHLVVADMEIKLPRDFYTLKLNKFAWNNTMHSVEIDSFRVKPDYDKTLFAKKNGVQTDRIDFLVPFVHADGVDLNLSRNSSLNIVHVTTGFTLEVFHDKRFPDTKPKAKELPSRVLSKLEPFLRVDTVSISKSSVTYEEFPVGGEKAGYVTFNQLDATIANLSTHPSREMTMSATTRFMNAGDLHVRFTFPPDPVKPYSIDGKLTNFSLPQINAILIPIAHAEVKSGHLNELKFAYSYNEYRADGKLTMNYKDLDLVSLVKNSKNNETNQFATLILKAFIIKKDMDKDKSQGDILFYRDPQRSTINYWWKSILSGVKSLYHLDKIADIHHAKKK